MEIRLTSKEDYQQLTEWWKFWRFPAPTIDLLPNGMQDGIMVTEEGVNLAAGFIYRTPSSIYWSEFIVANPEIKDAEKRQEAIIMLIHSICNLSKQMGAKHIFTSLKNESLIKHYEACGFMAMTKGGVEMIKVL